MADSCFGGARLDRLLVGREDQGRTIAGIIRERLNVSRSLLRRIKREGRILLKGQIRDKTMRRLYIAVAGGIIPEDRVEKICRLMAGEY